LQQPWKKSINTWRVQGFRFIPAMESESNPHPFFFIDSPLPRPLGLVLKGLFLQHDDIPIKL